MARPTPEQIRAAGEKAAQYLRAGLEAGRLAFRQGRPRESLANDAERIGYDEAAYDAAHAGVVEVRRTEYTPGGLPMTVVDEKPARGVAVTDDNPNRHHPPMGDTGIGGREK